MTAEVSLQSRIALLEDLVSLLTTQAEELHDESAKWESRVEELEEQIGSAPLFQDAELVNGHIPVNRLSFPNGSIGLDAAGNLTNISMDDGSWLVSVDG